MKTRARTSRLGNTAFGIGLVLFLTITLYCESFSLSEKPATHPEMEYRHVIQRSRQVNYSDTYLAKADSTNDYINIIGMTCLNAEDHFKISCADEESSEDYVNRDMSKKSLITVALADNKSALNKLFQGSAHKFDDQYITIIT